MMEKLMKEDGKRLYLSFRQLVVAMVVLAISAVVTVGLAEAAIYYVDYETGSDNNDGLSTASPWKHCPGDDNAADTAGYTSLLPGDTVIFKGGVQYYGRIDVDWSGSGGAYITYDGNSAGTWGTGKTIIDGGDTRYFGFYTTSARNYIKIDNFEIRNIAHRAVANGAGGIFLGSTSGQSSYITVQNCYVWDIGYWENDGSVIPSYAGGIILDYCDNCLIDSNEVTKSSKWGVRIYDGTNTIISNNNIHNYICWGVDIAYASHVPDSNIVRSNTIHDLWHYDCNYTTPCTAAEGCWQGSCVSPDNPHTDYIFVRRGPGSNPTNTIIEGNLFYNNKDFTGLRYDGTAFIYLSGATDTIVRNNILINPHSLYIFKTEAISSGTEIYNNVFYTPRSPEGYGVQIRESGVIAKNNIIVADTFNFFLENDAAEDNLISDYNMFVDPGTCVRKGTPIVNYADLLDWQSSGHGQDSHSLERTLAEIKFVDTSGFPASCSTMNLNLQSDSPCIDTGTTLTGFSDDIDGVGRPQGPAWDIGAYEYVAALTGDLNSDGSVNIQDIQACVNHILGTQDWGAAADVNGDSSVNVLDIQEIVNIILGV